MTGPDNHGESDDTVRPLSPRHTPCCPDHQLSMDCDTYRRTHVVTGDCCAVWTQHRPHGGWVPSGCPAGFSSECSRWTALGPCRCLLLAALTMPDW